MELSLPSLPLDFTYDPIAIFLHNSNRAKVSAILPPLLSHTVESLDPNQSLLGFRVRV